MFRTVDTSSLCVGDPRLPLKPQPRPRPWAPRPRPLSLGESHHPYLTCGVDGETTALAGPRLAACAQDVQGPLAGRLLPDGQREVWWASGQAILEESGTEPNSRGGGCRRLRGLVPHPESPGGSWVFHTLSAALLVLLAFFPVCKAQDTERVSEAVG